MGGAGGYVSVAGRVGYVSVVGKVVRWVMYPWQGGWVGGWCRPYMGVVGMAVAQDRKSAINN